MLDLSLLNLLPENERAAISDTMLDVMLARALDRAEETLPQEVRQEYEALFSEEHPDEEVAGFFSRHLPEFPQILVEEAFRLRAEIAEGAETE